MSRPTLTMVAERAGVSVATVSRSLHNDPAVVAETREHVLRICDELGYAPSPAGRRLKQGSKAVVGLSLGVHDHAVSRYVSLMHQALTSQLAASGWSVQLIRPSEFKTTLDVGGLILIGVLEQDPRLAALRGSALPTVAIGHETGGFCIAPDDVVGGRIAAQHLLARGCKRLAVLHGHDAKGGIARRVTSFIETVEAAGITPLRYDGEASTTPTLQGYRTIAGELARGASFEGLFCETDELAAGALAAIEDAGRSVPGDIAVIGFDDLPEFADRLTTIRQDIPLLAEMAMNLLNDARRGQPPRAVLLPVALMQRETA